MQVQQQPWPTHMAHNTVAGAPQQALAKVQRRVGSIGIDGGVSFIVHWCAPSEMPRWLLGT